ncbi:hypothetical protein ABZX77_34205 [Streptomyces sp. NPDC004237]|uniref:hypothetical protein n=1 Tax=Streptomyces sp. NPDC004237 TaxID=3154455 RepID=UPI0033B2A82B
MGSPPPLLLPHDGAARVPGMFRERTASLRTAVERAFDDAGRTSVRAVADHSCAST